MAKDVSVSTKSDSYERFLAKTKELHSQLSTVLRENKTTLESLNTTYVKLGDSTRAYVDGLKDIKKLSAAGVVGSRAFMQSSQSLLDVQKSTRETVTRLTSSFKSQEDVINSASKSISSAITISRSYSKANKDLITSSSSTVQAILDATEAGSGLRTELLKQEKLRLSIEDQLSARTSKTAKESKKAAEDKLKEITAQRKALEDLIATEDLAYASAHADNHLRNEKTRQREAREKKRLDKKEAREKAQAEARSKGGAESYMVNSARLENKAFDNNVAAKKKRADDNENYRHKFFNRIESKHVRALIENDDFDVARAESALKKEIAEAKTAQAKADAEFKLMMLEAKSDNKKFDTSARAKKKRIDANRMSQLKWEVSTMRSPQAEAMNIKDTAQKKADAAKGEVKAAKEANAALAKAARDLEKAARVELKAANDAVKAAKAEEKAAEKLAKEHMTTMKKAGKGLMSLITGLMGNGPFAFDEVISMNSPLSLLKYIWDVLKGIYKWLEKLDIGKWFDDLWNNIKTLTSQLWNTLGNWINSLEASVAGLGRLLQGLGPSILSGLELGLAGALSALGLGAVADLLRQLVEQGQVKKLGVRSTPRTRVVTESIVSGPQPQASPLTVTDPNSMTLGPNLNNPLNQNAFNPIPTSGSQGSPVRWTPTLTTQDKALMGAGVGLSFIKSLIPSVENIINVGLADAASYMFAIFPKGSLNPVGQPKTYATGGFHIREHLGIVGDVPEVTLPLNSASSKPAFDSIAQSIMKAGGSGMGNGDVHIHVGENSVNLMDNFTTDIFVRKIMERIQLIQGNTGQFNYNRI